MGKNLIQQRRGRGTLTYTAPSFNYVTDVKYRNYDDIEKAGVLKGKIVDLIHCPGHSAPLAKVRYENGEVLYLFAIDKIRVNDMIEAGMKATIHPGNIMPLKVIPEGTLIHNLESIPGDGGKFCRAAGSSAKLISFIQDTAIVRLPSKKTRKFNVGCRATIGVIAGSGKKEKPFIKAGRKFFAMRARGKLFPRTAACAMNPVDHPFGYGRGRQHAKMKVCSRNAPPGRKVGKVCARRTGRK